MNNQEAILTTQPSASDVTKYLLEKKGTLTGFQLQKLLYYCQAWCLTIEDRPLFSDEVRAYEHGPVVPSVSMQHKKKVQVHPADINGNSALLSNDDMAFIDTVLQAYDGLTGDQLELLTHQEEPWLKSYNQHTSISSSAIIPQKAMRDYYASLLTKSDAEQQAHHVPLFNHPKKLYVSSNDYDWLQDLLDSEE